jgi:hypothetical protein
MSLYREASRRRRLPLIAAVAALVVGLSAGFALGRATVPEPTISGALEDVSVDLSRARDALELLAIEYRQGVSEGRVTASTEYAAARTDLQTSRDSYANARDDVAVLAPGETKRVDRLLRELAALVELKAPPAAVAAKARETERALHALPGG